MFKIMMVFIAISGILTHDFEANIIFLTTILIVNFNSYPPDILIKEQNICIIVYKYVVS